MGVDREWKFRLNDICRGRHISRTALLPLLAGLIFSASPAFGCNVLPSAWSSTSDSGSNLEVVADAHFDAECGLRVHLDGINPAYVVDDTPDSLVPPAVSYSARFYVLVNDLALSAADQFVLFSGFDTVGATGSPLFGLVLMEESGQKKLRLVSYEDAGPGPTTAGSEATVLDGWRAIELSWAAATADGSNDGHLKLKIDNVEAQVVIDGLDNDTHQLASVGLGVVAGAASPTLAGSFNLDAFTSHRASPAGLIYKTCSGDTPEVDNITFLPGINHCVGTTSFTAGPVVTVDGASNLTVTSPQIRLRAGFTASPGSVIHLVSP